MGLPGLCHSIVAQVCTRLIPCIDSALTFLLGGSNDPSSHSSTTLPAQGVMVPLSLGARPLLPPMRWLEEHRRPSYISVPISTARLSKDSLAILRCGLCLSLEEDELENTPTASACCVVQLVPECAGCGTAKTMSGPKFTASTNGDGFTLTLVRRCGTIQGSTQRVSTYLQSFHFPILTVSRLEPQDCLLHCLLQRWCHRCHPSICSQLALSTSPDSLS